MRLNLRKTIAFVALAGVLAGSAASPAAADGWGWGRGYHGGWGHHGWGRGQWNNGGWNNGGAAAAAALGGFALGAVAGAASQPNYYGAGDGYCYFVDRPVTDGWGNVMEFRRVQVCE